MTKRELQALENGTLLYNGRTEGEIITDGKEKYIEICIPISSMSNDSNDFDSRPKCWSVIE